LPKIVDHDARRSEIIMATWRVIAAGGVAGATVREIAHEAGCSNGTLAHYFADRQDILASAMVTAHRGVRNRADAQLDGVYGLEALRVIMLECLPLDEQRVQEARIEACFWGEAIGNDSMMKLQNSEVEGFCARIRARLVEAEQRNELGPVALDDVVDELLALNDGCTIQAVLNPGRLPANRQVARLDAILGRIRRNSDPEPAGKSPGRVRRVRT
jgi:AcrR family transcriptional regulator